MIKTTKWRRLQYVSVTLLASSLVTFAPLLDESFKAESAATLPPVSTDSTIESIPMTTMAADITPTEKKPDKRYFVYQVNGNQQVLMNRFQNLNDAVLFAKGSGNTKVVDDVTRTILWNNIFPSASVKITAYVPPPKPGVNPSFDNALAFVLSWEGGYSNLLNDHGGATNQGITQSEYDRFRKAKGLIAQDVRRISNDELREIYYSSYWLPVHGNDLSYPLALSLFDSSVNCGPGTAIIFLEKSLGLPLDGGWGPNIGKTLAAKTSSADIALQIVDYRHEYYKLIADIDTTQVVFLKGWLNRNDALRDLLSQWIVRNHLYLDQAKWYIQKKNVYNAAYYAALSVKNGIIQAKDAVSLGDPFTQNDRIAFYLDLTTLDATSAMKLEVKNRLLSLGKSYLMKNDFEHAANYAMQALPLGATAQEVVGLADSLSKPSQSKYWVSLLHTGQDTPPVIDAELMRRQSVAVTGISLDKTSFSLTQGDSPQKLNALLAPANATNQKVTWNSDNVGVVTVDSNGVITPVGVGKADITVRAMDGGKTVTCSITVAPKLIPVAGVSIDNTSLSLTLGDSEKKLNALLVPVDATNQKVSWTSDNEKVATVTPNGVVTPVGVGTTTVTVTTEDGGVKAVCSITVVSSDPTNAAPVQQK